MTVPCASNFSRYSAPFFALRKTRLWGQRSDRSTQMKFAYISGRLIATLSTLLRQWSLSPRINDPFLVASSPVTGQEKPITPSKPAIYLRAAHPFYLVFPIPQRRQNYHHPSLCTPKLVSFSCLYLLLDCLCVNTCRVKVSSPDAYDSSHLRQSSNAFLPSNQT